MFVIIKCIKCNHSFEYYQKRNEIPPCKYCGYPELKTSKEYYKAMGIV